LLNSGAAAGEEVQSSPESKGRILGQVAKGDFRDAKIRDVVLRKD
jgi:hypothetical protein